jgi:hypothetical protein
MSEGLHHTITFHEDPEAPKEGTRKTASSSDLPSQQYAPPPMSPPIMTYLHSDSSAGGSISGSDNSAASAPGPAPEPGQPSTTAAAAAASSPPTGMTLSGWTPSASIIAMTEGSTAPLAKDHSLRPIRRRSSSIIRAKAAQAGLPDFNPPTPAHAINIDGSAGAGAGGDGEGKEMKSMEKDKAQKQVTVSHKEGKEAKKGGGGDDHHQTITPELHPEHSQTDWRQGLTAVH